MRIRNLRPYEVEIPDVGWVEPNGEIDVPDELAHGTPAVGDDPTDDGYHPGVSGLLAQQDAWAAVKTKHKPADAGEEG